jgi:hypothetical protein
MGRPLHKKYFGNRNIGTTGTTDTAIGGEGLDTFTLAGLGSVTVNPTYALTPVLQIPAPSFPGVQATATVVWEINSITVANGLAGHGYTTGDATLTGLAGVVVHVHTVGSGQGEIQVVDFDSVGSNRGEFTTIPNVNASYQVVKAGSDNNNQVNVTWRVKSITINEKGSGYIAPPSLTWAAGGTGPLPGNPTVSLTTDSGSIGSTTNQENAIVITAKLTSSAGIISDIIKQVSGRRYKVWNTAGTGVVKLVDTQSLELNQAFIRAFDNNGNIYLVTKLTAHKAKLVQHTQNGANAWLFTDGQAVHWTFSSPSESTVQIENA